MSKVVARPEAGSRVPRDPKALSRTAQEEFPNHVWEIAEFLLHSWSVGLFHSWSCIFSLMIAAWAGNPWKLQSCFFSLMPVPKPVCVCVCVHDSSDSEGKKKQFANLQMFPPGILGHVGFRRPCCRMRALHSARHRAIPARWRWRLRKPCRLQQHQFGGWGATFPIWGLLNRFVGWFQ